MSRMTRDNWLVYAIFREIDGKEKAEIYRHKVNARNAGLGISGDGGKSAWSLVKADFDEYLEIKNNLNLKWRGLQLFIFHELLRMTVDIISLPILILLCFHPPISTKPSSL